MRMRRGPFAQHAQRDQQRDFREISMYQHVLISTDGSEIARKGVDDGLALAKGLGAKVTIVTATERLPVYSGIDGSFGAVPYSAYSEGQKEAAERVLADAKEAAGRLGVSAETVLCENTVPAEAIIDTAKARNCSLIAMASHGRRGLGRLILGSVTSEVLARSPVPVLVVR
jgi:nucleotide-binding universal stress UspA family protein